MTKESIYELQCLDCNCNNCEFLQRDLKKFEDSLLRHHKWQLDYFNVIKDNLIKKAQEWERKGEFEKAKVLFEEAAALKFQFNKIECRINYGTCTKFCKLISFIPNICQLETQHCFVHRMDKIKTPSLSA